MLGGAYGADALCTLPGRAPILALVVAIILLDLVLGVPVGRHPESAIKGGFHGIRRIDVPPSARHAIGIGRKKGSAPPPRTRETVPP